MTCLQVINLTPAYRVRARRKRQRVRVWSIAASVYGVTLLMGWALLASAIGVADVGSVDARIMRARGEADAARRTVGALDAKIAASRRTLNASRAVTRQPDWSLLIRLTAAAMSEDMTLRRIALVSVRDDGAQRTSSAMAGRRRSSVLAEASVAVSGAGLAEHPHAFEVDGYAADQVAVQQYVLQLERLGVFEKVELQHSRREPFLAGEAVAFSIRCRLISSKPGAGGR